MRALRFIIVILFSLSFHGSLLGQETPLYKDAQAPLEQRVTDLFGRLTQDEKLSLLGGAGFTTQPIPRLGVPAMGMCDAGQGVRGGMEARWDRPRLSRGVLMASTWDTNLIWQIGRAIGEEARNKGTGIPILLGPAVNIHRSPLGGRNANISAKILISPRGWLWPTFKGCKAAGSAPASSIMPATMRNRTASP